MIANNTRRRDRETHPALSLLMDPDAKPANTPPTQTTASTIKAIVPVRIGVGKLMVNVVLCRGVARHERRPVKTERRKKQYSLMYTNI